MKRLFVLILTVVLLAAGMSFATLNAHVVKLNYYAGETEGPLALITVLAMALGAVLGVLGSLSVAFSQRREAARLRRRVQLCEHEIRNLRQIPIADRH